MFAEKARLFFLGRGGLRRLNCCQSVAQAFKDEFHLSDDVIDELESCGFGRASQGRCGALYAMQILLKDDPQKIQECEAIFQARAGSLKCREIRALGQLSCVGCVEVIAHCIQNVQK